MFDRMGRLLRLIAFTSLALAGFASGEASAQTGLLKIISEPDIAFLLFMLGVYGILFEFWHPGALVPGVVGAIAIVLALTALSSLPVQYGALLLLLFGIALMIGETFTPGIGILGIGGVIAFATGATFLFDGSSGASLSVATITGTTLATAALIFGVIGAAMKARKRPPAAGADPLIGTMVEVVDWQDGGGHVRAQGEIWSARASGGGKPQPNDKVKISGREGLTLIVEP